MSRRGSNIYKRSDGRYEGRIKLGYDENGRSGISMFTEKRLRNARTKWNFPIL